MSTSPSELKDAADQGQLISARFASLVIQNSNMALIFLGQAPNPQTGETVRDLEHARYFIDQLEMLEVKTKGNLDKNEASLLKQSLTSLRFAFVEAASQPDPAPQDKSAPPTPPAPASAAAAAAAPATDEQEMPIIEPVLPGEKTAPPPPAEEEESRKKFSKKY
jgi:hypothetical protein